MPSCDLCFDFLCSFSKQHVLSPSADIITFPGFTARHMTEFSAIKFPFPYPALQSPSPNCCGFKTYSIATNLTKVTSHLCVTKSRYFSCPLPLASCFSLTDKPYPWHLRCLRYLTLYNSQNWTHRLTSLACFPSIVYQVSFSFTVGNLEVVFVTSISLMTPSPSSIHAVIPSVCITWLFLTSVH